MESKKRLGCLWEKTSQKGLTYMSGTLYLEGGVRIPVVAFKAKTKTKPTSPDWDIFEAKKPGEITTKPETNTPLFKDEDNIPF